MRACREIIALSLLSAVGCGEAMTVEPPETVEDFEQAYRRALCESLVSRAIHGLHGIGDEAFQTQLGDVEGCLEWSAGVDGVGQPMAPAWADAVHAGLADYDAQAAEACLAWTRTTSVQNYVFMDTLDPCAAAVVGRGAEGDPCDASFHCSPGTYCTAPYASLCGGICAPAVEVGGTCRSTPECGDPSRRYCLGDLFAGEPGTCVTGAPRTVGLGASCGGASFCERGLACQLDSDLSWFECAAPLAEGEPCSFDTSCVAQTLCMSDASGTYRCATPTVVAEEGASCGGLEQVSCAWLEGLDCVDGRCQRLVSGDEGARCSRAVPGTCAEGLSCVRVGDAPTVCVRPGSDGAACTTSSECQPDLTCDAGRCAAPVCT